MKKCNYCHTVIKQRKFANKNQKYCSLKCRSRVYYNIYYKHYQWKKNRKCKICGNNFIPQTFNQLYCKNPCNARKYWKMNNKKKFNKWQREHYRKTKIDLVEKKCLLCRSEFLPKVRNQKFCFDKCRNKHNEIIKKKDGRKKIYAERYRQLHKDEIKEKDNYYREKISFGIDKQSKSTNRKLTLERDNHTCQMCGSKKLIVVHHKKYPATIKDLITLCRSCHAYIHKRPLALKKSSLIDLETLCKKDDRAEGESHRERLNEKTP